MSPTSIKGLSHITFSVRSLQRSLDFYQHQLGFELIARWKRGAYLVGGDIWLCLIESTNYDHIAFSIEKGDLQAINHDNIRKWKENSSFGESLYILDPDNHQLELHTSNLPSRLTYLEKHPYEDLIIQKTRRKL